MQKVSFETPGPDERGVSPVIGVILMVAVTAILGAVIASFAFSFPAQVGDSTRAGVGVSVDGNTAQVTWVSEGNAEKLRVEVTNESGGSVTSILHRTGEFVTVDNLEKSGGMCSPHSGEITVNSSDVTVVVTAVNGDSETVVKTENVYLD